MDISALKLVVQKYIELGKKKADLAAHYRVPLHTINDLLRAAALAGFLNETPYKTNFSNLWYGDNNRILFDDGKTLELESLPERVLVFSCLQAPFHHPDALAFLSAVKASYQPDFVVCAGDEADLSFLKKQYMSSDSLSPKEELRKTQEFMKSLFELFPRAICLTSNHVDARIGYSATQGNIPTVMLRTWQDIIEAPDGWTWRDYLIMRNWLFEHGHSVPKGSRASIDEDVTKRFGRAMSVMKGHFHSEFGDHIKPKLQPGGWYLRICFAGSLMDRRNVTYTRSATMNGCVMLIRGVPHPIPMILGKTGEWCGELKEW